VVTHLASTHSRGVGIPSVVVDVRADEVVGDSLIGVVLIGVATTERVESFVVFGSQDQPEGQSTQRIVASFFCPIVISAAGLSSNRLNS
jgi:hypothetical protein